MREIALYGSQVVKITGSYDQAKQVAAEFARQRGLVSGYGCAHGHGSRSDEDNGI